MSVLPVAVILGGYGTRLGALTTAVPKSMVEVNGEPFIAHMLRLLSSKGLKEIVLCVGYLGQSIQAFVGDGSAFGLSVRYSEDGEVPLGTAGAIQKARPLLGENFFVLYGDSYLQCEYLDIGEAFIRSEKLAMMTVFNNANAFDKSNVVFRDGNIVKYDKASSDVNMQHIDYGLGVFNARVFEQSPFDLADLYQRLLASNQLSGYEVTQRFYEIGSLRGLQALSQFFSIRNKVK